MVRKEGWDDCEKYTRSNDSIDEEENLEETKALLNRRGERIHRRA